MKDSEAKEGEGKALATPGDRRMGPLSGDTGLTPSLQEDAPKDCEMGDEELPTESGGEPTDAYEEPAAASRRLIPNPESPTNSGGPIFRLVSEDPGNSVPLLTNSVFPLGLRNA